MATIFSHPALLSSTSAAAENPPPHLPHKTTPDQLNHHPSRHSNPYHHPTFTSRLPTTYRLYYGTAANYGGNSDKKASAEYSYDVPDGWKEKLVSMIQKGTNGTDSEFFSPKKKTEKVYLTFLDGFGKLAPKDLVLNNLAPSDIDLQDLIATAENAISEERNEDKGQLYYVYEIDGVGAHSLISVTCANNKLYAHFVKAPTPE